MARTTDDALQLIILEAPSAEDGGGWLATVPDLPGLYRPDRDTREEALSNARAAIGDWNDAAEELGRPVPTPGGPTGQWRQRVPRTLHEKLRRLAKSEGVSLNQRVTSVLAEAVGRRTGQDSR
jgi:antitoxin HicB